MKGSGTKNAGRTARWGMVSADTLYYLQALALALAVAWLWRTWFNREEVLGDAVFSAPNPIPPLLALVALGVVALSVRLSNQQQTRILQFSTHAVALIPAALLFWGWWYWEYLDSEWVRDATFFTGKSAIVLLVLSLAVTPLNTLFGWKQIIPLRKPFGNFAFAYVVVHLTLFVLDYARVDASFQLGLAVSEALKKPYALVGFIAFLLLVPLAATSNKWSMKQLGKRWKQLHKLAYLIGVLAVTHYIWVWASKRALSQPVAFALIVAFLLFLRIKPVKDSISRVRRSVTQARRRAVARGQG